MATMYCHLCQRPVEARRHFGIGTLILLILTWAQWLIVMPFYPKRCPICQSTALSKVPKATSKP